jgi:hypothetical protein
VNKKTLMLAGLLVIATVATAHGHAGGLDSNGGHTNKKTGEYHYHRKKPDPPPASTPSSTQAATVTAPTSSPPATMAEMRDRLFECREVQDSLARLSCFETLTNSLAAANAK